MLGDKTWVRAEDSFAGLGSSFKILCALLFVLCALGLEAKPVPSEIAKLVDPYLLPEHHPVKASLDRLFSENRVILNLKNLQKAGFNKVKPRKFTKLIVTKHPDFPGYVFKLYLDAQGFHKDLPEYHYWILRIQGVEKIRQEIAVRGLEHYFKVPKKWIYALPRKPVPPKGYANKHYILVEEDMDILANEENKELWKSDYVTRDLLNELYGILKTVGLHDCAKPDNIPFARDGRIAFIDTQSHGMEVEYKKLNPFLSKENLIYWKTLTAQ